MMGHSGPFTNGAWELLRRVTTSGRPSAVQFSSLPPCRAFRLRIMGLRRDSGSSLLRSARLYFNDDIDSGLGNYRYLQRRTLVSGSGVGTSTTEGSASSDFIVAFWYPDLAGDPARVVNAEIVIADSPNRYKTVEMKSVLTGASEFYFHEGAGVWAVTNRIQSIRIVAAGATEPRFENGALFVLEGIV